MTKPTAKQPASVQVTTRKIANGYLVTRAGTHRGRPYETTSFSQQRPKVTVTAKQVTR